MLFPMGSLRWQRIALLVSGAGLAASLALGAIFWRPIAVNLGTCQIVRDPSLAIAELAAPEGSVRAEALDEALASSQEVRARVVRHFLESTIAPRSPFRRPGGFHCLAVAGQGHRLYFSYHLGGASCSPIREGDFAEAALPALRKIERFAAGSYAMDERTRVHLRTFPRDQAASAARGPNFSRFPPGGVVCLFENELYAPDRGNLEALLHEDMPWIQDQAKRLLAELDASAPSATSPPNPGRSDGPESKQVGLEAGRD